MRRGVASDRGRIVASHLYSGIPTAISVDDCGFASHRRHGDSGKRAFQNAGTVVSVQATTNPGYQFANFSGGALSGSTNPQNVIMNGPTNVVANFTPIAPNLAASVGARTPTGSLVLVSLTLTNTGLGAATNATISSITAITDVAGSGTVTASPTPVNLGTINPGSSAMGTVTFAWPSTATRVSFTINFIADGGYSGSSKITTLY